MFLGDDTGDGFQVYYRIGLTITSKTDKTLKIVDFMFGSVSGLSLPKTTVKFGRETAKTESEKCGQ